MVEKVITLENVSLLEFLGVDNDNIKEIASAFPESKIISRGNEIRIQGSSPEIIRINQILYSLLDRYNKFGKITRDEVKTVNDKVPILGDIPGIGRLFRSEGESRQKRNLLIFVTANLVSPGGSPSRQNYRNVNANSLFQNPTIMTPSGSVNRSIDAVAE